MAFFIFIFLLLLIAYCALFLLYSRGWNKLQTFPFSQIYNAKTRVSVIIPARNEEKYIKKCIDSILLQNYSAFFEVIVVNDHSTDNTLNILNSYGNQIKIINLEEVIAQNKLLKAYKKKAIEIAIQQSQGDLIITTDADTIRTNNWISSFVQCYETNKYKIIAAPVNYISEKKILTIFQIIDFLTMQGITAASLYYHFNSTCNGANLAYSKKTFFDVDGFKDIDNIASGDDMLLLHKIETKYPKSAYYLKSQQAIINTYAMPSLNSFLQQRIRWASKAKHYSDKRVTAVLGSVFLFNIALFIILLLTFFGKFNILLCLFFLILKVCFELLLIKPVLNFFDKKNLLIWHIILQPFHIIYIIFCGAIGQLKTYDWKGRKVE